MRHGVLPFKATALLEKKKTTIQENTMSCFTEKFTKRRKSIEGKWPP